MYTKDKTKIINFRVNEKTLKRIDELRGNKTRTEFLVNLIETMEVHREIVKQEALDYKALKNQMTTAANPANTLTELKGKEHNPYNMPDTYVTLD